MGVETRSVLQPGKRGNWRAKAQRSVGSQVRKRIPLRTKTASILVVVAHPAWIGSNANGVVVLMDPTSQAGMERMHATVFERVFRRRHVNRGRVRRAFRASDGHARRPLVRWEPSSLPPTRIEFLLSLKKKLPFCDPTTQVVRLDPTKLFQSIGRELPINRKRVSNPLGRTNRGETIGRGHVSKSHNVGEAWPPTRRR